MGDDRKREVEKEGEDGGCWVKRRKVEVSELCFEIGVS